MSDSTSDKRRVAVYFGREVYLVTVEIDPANPPTKDAIIDRAREIALQKHSPPASFRKGEIVE